jgi:hypothetical protein
VPTPGFTIPYSLSFSTSGGVSTLTVVRPLAHASHAIQPTGPTSAVFATGPSSAGSPIQQHGSNKGVGEHRGGHKGVRRPSPCSAADPCAAWARTWASSCSSSTAEEGLQRGGVARGAGWPDDEVQGHCEHLLVENAHHVRVRLPQVVAIDFSVGTLIAEPMPSPTTSTSPSGSKAPAVSSMCRQAARPVPTPSCATNALALHLWPPPLAVPHPLSLHPAAETRILSSPSGAPASSQTLGASRDAGSPTSLATATAPPSGPSLSSSRSASPSRSASVSSPPPQAAYGPQSPSPSHSPSHGALGSLDTTTVHRTDLSTSAGVKLAWQFANGGTVAITASVSQLGWWVGKAVSMPKAHLFGGGAGPLISCGCASPMVVADRVLCHAVSSPSSTHQVCGGCEPLGVHERLPCGRSHTVSWAGDRRGSIPSRHLLQREPVPHLKLRGVGHVCGTLVLVRVHRVRFRQGHARTIHQRPLHASRGDDPCCMFCTHTSTHVDGLEYLLDSW